MTPLQSAIGKIKSINLDPAYNAHYHWGHGIAKDQIVAILESFVKEEETQLRDTWEAAEDYFHEDGYGRVPNVYPDIETYINNLKK